MESAQIVTFERGKRNAITNSKAPFIQRFIKSYLTHADDFTCDLRCDI